MKKLLVASVLALALLMGSRQSASAWSEFKFSAGVNFGWVGGGNRILWGAYHSAPFPGNPDLGPWFPGLFPGYPPVAPVAPVVPIAPQAPHHAYNPYYNSGYQPVGYYDAGYSQQAPSYWYGR